MGLYRPWLTTPELQYCSLLERKYWWDIAWQRARVWKSPLFWFLMVAIFCVGVPLVFYFAWLRTVVGGWVIVLPGIFGFTAATLINLVFSRRVRRAIRDRLDISYEGRVMPCCIECGYSLDGCTETTQACSECGNTHIRGNPTAAIVRLYKFGF